jgi:hypothetical protein
MRDGDQLAVSAECWLGATRSKVLPTALSLRFEAFEYFRLNFSLS